MITFAGLTAAASFGANSAICAIMPFAAVFIFFAMSSANAALYITGVTALTFIVIITFLANTFMAAFALGTFIRIFANGVANTFNT
jgi:hypothetical protein